MLLVSTLTISCQGRPLYDGHQWFCESNMCGKGCSLLRGLRVRRLERDDT